MQAQADARSACVELLSLGATVAQHTSVLGSSAYGALVYARQQSLKAASLDHRWAYLAESVRSIGASFVSGERGALVAELDDLAVACRPLVGGGQA